MSSILPYYMTDGFNSTISLLYKLKVLNLKYHKVGHSLTLIMPLNTYVQSHWIPLPVVDIYAHYVEIIVMRNL